MTASTEWRISLSPMSSGTPAGADEVFLPPEERSKVAASEVRADVPHWLKEGDPRSQEEVAVLVREAEDLLGRRVVSDGAWKIVPGRDALLAGDETLAGLAARADESLHLLETGRLLLASLGAPEEPGVVEAAQVIERLATARDELSRVAQTALRLSGRKISVRDAAVLADVGASLTASHVGSAWLAPAYPQLLEAVAEHYEAVEVASASIATEFGFDPRTWSEAAFGGITRAFESSRATDFLLATKKLGIEVSTPAQAKRAAELFRSYISAVRNLKETLRLHPAREGTSESGHLRGKMARIKLGVSLKRRLSVLGISSDFVSSIPCFDLSEFDDLSELAPSDDAAALAKANDTVTDDGSLDDLISSVGDQIGLLERWRTVVAEASTECGSSRWADVERQVRGLRDEAEELSRHLAWVREASMLPLSDEELQWFLDHAACRP